jgi:hypothetical protein
VGQGKGKPVSRAENLIRDDLTRAVAAALDTTFLSADAVDDATPPGILNGIVAITANADIAHSLRGLLDDFSGDLSRAVFVATPSVYAAMTSATYLRVGLRDGMLMNAPALVSKYAPASSSLLVTPCALVSPWTRSRSRQRGKPRSKCRANRHRNPMKALHPQRRARQWFRCSRQTRSGSAPS